jgi:hypothetical protein
MAMRGYSHPLVVLLGALLAGCAGSSSATTTPTTAPTPVTPAAAAATASGSPALRATPTSGLLAQASPVSGPPGVATPASASPASGRAASCTPSGAGRPQPSPVPDAPVRASVGQGHVLRGVVRSGRDCAPIAGARIVLWWANPQGQYDDAHRAAVFTDGAGAYRLESTFPGSYGGASPHFHLYASAPGHRGVELEYLATPGQSAGTYDLVLAPESR